MQNLMGQTLGQYKVISLIGEGGMAAVYRAHQDSMNREVAIKVIKTNLIDMEDFLQRFQREAQTVASLSHPHILKVFDYGRHEDIVYLVMELLTGGSLDELIRKGPLSLQQTSAVLDQISNALDYAHQKGIIHRDIKPENVLLDEAGNAFLTDFGLAKLLHSESRLTQSGAAMGTPAYMSPEQWRGQPLDARSDVYALGVLLFEMLSGILPFKGETSLSMMYLHIHEPPPALRSIRPDVPASIETVVLRALAKEPEDRFASAGQLAADFRAAVEGKPITSLPQPASVRRSAHAPISTRLTPEAGTRQWRWLGVAAVMMAVLGVGSLTALRSAATVIPTATPAPTATTVPAIPPAVPVAQGPVGGPGAGNQPSAPRILTGHAAKVTSVFFALDGQYLASGSLDKTARLWNPQTGEEIRVFEGHPEGVTSVRISPNGSYLLTGSADSTARLWELQTGKPIRTFTGHTGPVQAAVFSPDGQYVLTTSADKTAKLWDTQTGTLVRTLAGMHSLALTRAAFAPDGRTAVTASEDKTAVLFEVQSGKVLQTLTGHTGPIYDVAFSPDSPYILTGSADGTARLWDVNTGKLIQTLNAQGQDVFAVAFAPSGSGKALTAGKEGLVQDWDVLVGRRLGGLGRYNSAIYAVDMAPPGVFLLAAAPADNTIRLTPLRPPGQR